MVRRLKDDLREIDWRGFPTRIVLQIDIDGLPEPTLLSCVLSRLLDQYRATPRRAAARENQAQAERSPAC